MNKPIQKPDDTWMMVAEVIGTLEAEIVGGMLRSYDIPVYLDLDNPRSLFPSSAFGQLQGIVRIFVPEMYYDVAVGLLESDEPDDPALDDPDIFEDDDDE